MGCTTILVGKKATYDGSVSYTHLTLPTKRIVVMSGVDESIKKKNKNKNKKKTKHPADI